MLPQLLPACLCAAVALWCLTDGAHENTPNTLHSWPCVLWLSATCIQAQHMSPEAIPVSLLSWHACVAPYQLLEVLP
jgi:hypothetical protein